MALEYADPKYNSASTPPAGEWYFQDAGDGVGDWVRETPAAATPSTSGSPQYIGTYDEYLQHGGRDTYENYYAANPGAPVSARPAGSHSGSSSSSSGSSSSGSKYPTDTKIDTDMLTTGGPTEVEYESPYPEDYGLTGEVAPIDTSGMQLKPWENVNVPWNPEFMDQYKKWAESGFIDRQVQPEDTVAWQMENLLDKQNPYITSARQRGMEQAASRGLLNSSLAAGSAERAAIDAALPIAQQDASTYFSQGINNQNLANQFALARQNAGMTGMMEMDKLHQTLDAEFAKFNGEMALKVESFNSTMNFEEAMTARNLAQAELETRAKLWNALDTAMLSSQTSIATANIGANASMTNANIASQTSIATANIGASAQIEAANISAASAASANYHSGLLKIWSDPNTTPQQQAVFADRWASAWGYALSNGINWQNAYL